MYNLEFLPIAKNDIDDIIYYISHNLKNSTAALKLAKSFMNSINIILEFPYSFSVYNNTSLKYQYRNLKIKHFLIFYTIDDNKKKVVIVRVLYEKMDIDNILE